MTTARNHRYFLNESTYFHLMNRCVRRAFLCGKDKLTGKSYKHRKRWLHERLLKLSELFFVDLYGYAVMSNHYHVVLHTRPDAMSEAGDEDIARRWCKLFPQQNTFEEIRIIELCKIPELISLYRQRLSDISWLMQCLNQHLAFKANREDKLNGRFWQGRFKSQILLDEAAVVTCMAYVDLNPLRAGIAKTLETSNYTSIQYRVHNHIVDEPLKPIISCSMATINAPDITLGEYLSFVDEAARQNREGKSATLSDNTLLIVDRLKINCLAMQRINTGFTQLFYRVIGSIEHFERITETMGLKWLKGQRAAKEIFS